MKKILPLLSLFVALVIALTACSQPAAPAPAATQAPAAKPAEKPVEKAAEKPAAPAPTAQPAAQPAAKPAEKPAAAAPVQTIEWKAVAGWAKGILFRTYWVEPFIDRVAKETNGQLKMTLVGPEAWPTFEQVKAVRDGAFDITFSTPAFYEDMMPGAFAANLVYAPAKERRDKGMFAAFEKEYAKKVNSKYIVEFAMGAQNHIFTKPKVTKIEDFRGMKLRSARGYDPMMVGLGASPTDVSVEETLPALERGVVQGLMFPGVPFTAMKYHEYTKYVIFPGLGEVIITGMVNQNSWSKLPKNVQDAVEKAARDTETELRPGYIKLYEEEVQKMLASGMEKVTLSDADSAKYLDLLVDEYMKQMFVPRSPEFATEMKAILAKFPKLSAR